MNSSVSFLPASFYHVYNRGIASEQIFLNKDNYDFFKRKCELYLPHFCQLYAYAFLPNHFHLLIKTLPASGLDLKTNENYSIKISKLFSNLFNSYSKSFNSYHHRTGTLFEQS